MTSRPFTLKSFIPFVDDGYSIGNTNLRWRDGYFGHDVYSDGYVHTVGIKYSDGSTSTTSSGGGGGGSTSPGGSSGQIQVNSSGSFAGFTNLVYDIGSGNVGIGTASPLTASGKKLTLSNSGDSQVIFHNSSGATNEKYGYSGISSATTIEHGFVNDAIDNGASYLVATRSGFRVDSVKIQTGNPTAVRLTVNDTGLVGIGTSSLGGDQLTVKNTVTGGGVHLVATDSVPSRFGISNTGGSQTSSVVELGLALSSADFLPEANTGDAILRQAGTANKLILATNNTSRFTIDGSGNIGIGTSSPSRILHIRKDQDSEVFQFIENRSSGGSARAALLLGDSTSEYGYFQYTGSGYTPSGLIQPRQLTFTSTNGSTGGFLLVAQGGPLIFATNGVTATDEVFRITTTKRFGFGDSNSSPTCRFSIKSTVSETLFQVREENVGASTFGQFTLLNDNTGLGNLFTFSTQRGTNLTINSYDSGTNLKTRLGINYSLSSGNGTTDFVNIGAKKAPVIELNAEDGSIRLLAENGTGSDSRNPTYVTALYVSSAASVGINTISPNEKLTLSGILSIAETTTPTNTSGFGKIYPKSDGYLYFLNGSNTEYNLMSGGGGGGSSSGVSGSVQFSGGSGAFSSDASNFFWDNTNKRLGIGTTSPTSIVEIRSAASTVDLNVFGTDAASSVYSTVQNTTNSAYTEMMAFGASVGGTILSLSKAGMTGIESASNTSFVFRNASNTPMVFGTNELERMRIAADGKIGIGTTNPATFLHVYNSANASTEIARFDNPNSGSGARTYITVATSDRSGYMEVHPSNSGTFVAGMLRFQQSNEGIAFTADGGTGIIKFHTGGDGNAFERMRIADSGNVGIGTTNPNSKSHIVGSQSSSIATISTTTTLDETHFVVLADASSGNITVNLPTVATIPGRRYTIKKIDGSANTVDVDANSTETIDGALTQTLSGIYETITIQNNGTAWFVV